MKKNLTFLFLILFTTLPLCAQEPTDTLQPYSEQQLDEVQVVHRKMGTTRMQGAINGSFINQNELMRAACCNLGESFQTNPSVDVNYDDATTGARQIKLLGLSGIYVQMLAENVPDWRGAALPYALGYVPGPWLKSIQVSKGTASVRNGFEAITGQINTEYLKPEDKETANLNIYGDSESRLEANFDANKHFSKKLSTILLGHFENRWGHHDSNKDGYQDMPNVRQYHLMNRWAYLDDRYIFHGGWSVLDESRQSGQASHTADTELLDGTTAMPTSKFQIHVDNRRYNAYMKHAYFIEQENGTNIALMASATVHNQKSRYGIKQYTLNQQSQYAQLMFETNMSQIHNLSAGITFSHDIFHQYYDKQQLFWIQESSLFNATGRQRVYEQETTAGGYAQYTLNLNSKLIFMAGARLDYIKEELQLPSLSFFPSENNAQWKPVFTPRIHLKWQPFSLLTLRLSAGLGSRQTHTLAEYNYLMASGRDFTIESSLIHREKAWNWGVSAQTNISAGDNYIRLNADYYFTRFSHQTAVDYDTSKHVLFINPNAHGYSHALQVDASYELLRGLDITAALRRNFVKSTFNSQQQMPPLVSKYKGLLTGSYKTRLELWQFDVTLQLNGGGRMPTPYLLDNGSPSWSNRFHAYEQLSAQVTRWFRNFSVYLGGENLTGYKQSHPIVAANDPWSQQFEPTLIWGPVQGAMVYAGIRIKLK